LGLGQNVIIWVWSIPQKTHVLVSSWWCYFWRW
jgi:hypothetical protein